MQEFFNFNLEKISSSKNEVLDREKSLQLFLDKGFPNKKDENWKFSDLKSIVNKNFKSITNNYDFETEKKIDFIKNFDHNYIILVNGLLKTSEIKFEEKGKITIESINSQDVLNDFPDNNLHSLNKALSLGGFVLKIKENYKCQKPIIIYNYFTSNLDNKIINNSNKIKLEQNSELILIEYNDNRSNYVKCMNKDAF